MCKSSACSGEPGSRLEPNGYGTATRTQILKECWKGINAGREPKQNDQKPLKVKENSGTLPRPEGDLHQSPYRQLNLELNPFTWPMAQPVRGACFRLHGPDCEGSGSGTGVNIQHLERPENRSTQPANLGEPTGIPSWRGPCSGRDPKRTCKIGASQDRRLHTHTR